jgi:multidrug efflux pump subunit AcrB
MVAIPLGMVGAVFGHLVLGYDLTIMSVFGMAAMAGVVVNDSLVLLDQINVSIAKGEPVFQATINSGQIRFRAVLLTTVTTIAGLAPLLLERSSQAQTLIPMAISMTFGLGFATVLTLVIVPALYLATNDARRAARWLWRGGPYPTPEIVEPLHGSASLP